MCVFGDNSREDSRIEMQDGNPALQISRSRTFLWHSWVHSVGELYITMKVIVVCGSSLEGGYRVLRL